MKGALYTIAAALILSAIGGGIGSWVRGLRTEDKLNDVRAELSAAIAEQKLVHDQVVQWQAKTEKDTQQDKSIKMLWSYTAWAEDGIGQTREDLKLTRLKRPVFNAN